MKKYRARFFRANGSEVDERLTSFFTADTESSFDRSEFNKIERLFVAAESKTLVSVEKVRLYFHDGSFVEYEDMS